MRAALTVGRLDFWNINTGQRTDDLTPYEELVWRVYEFIEPWGERRADMRTAIQTLQLMQIQSPKLFSDEQREKIIGVGMGYLKSEDDGKIATPDEAARMGKAAFAAIGK